MSDKIHYKPLRINMMLSIILFILLPVLLAISLIDYFSARNDLMNSFNRLNIQTEKNIKKSIQIADAGFKMLNKSLDEKMEKAFIPFLKEYEDADGDITKINLEQLKEEYGMDFFIINDENIVVKTTKESDRGLDFNQWPDFAANLKKMREGEGYYADRMVPSVKEQNLTKWAYHPTPDNKYLFELGLQSKAFNHLFTEIDPEHIADELEEFNPAIMEIQLLDKDLKVKEVDYIEAEISEDIKEQVKDLWGNKDKVIEDKKNGWIVRYFYINRYDENYASDTSRIIRIKYSTKDIYNRLTQKTIYHILSAVIGIILSIVITYIVAHRIADPIHELIEDVNIIANGNLKHKIKLNTKNELRVLEKSINKMVNSTVQHLEDIKEREMENLRLQEEEEALIQFTETLNEQTMSIGRLERELQYKTKLLEKFNIKLNEANDKLKRRNDQLMEELEMAKRVQENIIPKDSKYSDASEFHLSSKYLSMESIGGDLYDIIKIDHNNYGFLMADVSGHGVPAALITTMAKVAFNTYSQPNKSPAEVCDRVNKDFMELIGDLAYFLTAYYCILDLKTGKLQYTNGGHHPAILYRKRTKTIEKLDADGSLIGAFPFDVTFEYDTTQLEEGDRVLLMTDGIIEAKNNEEVLYGYPRLMEYIEKYSQLEPKDFVTGLIRNVDAFCEGRPPDDDRAVLYFEFNHKMAKTNNVSDSINIEAQLKKSDLRIDDENMEL